MQCSTWHGALKQSEEVLKLAYAEPLGERWREGGSGGSSAGHAGGMCSHTQMLHTQWRPAVVRWRVVDHAPGTADEVLGGRREPGVAGRDVMPRTYGGRFRLRDRSQNPTARCIHAGARPELGIHEPIFVGAFSRSYQPPKLDKPA